MNDDHLTRITLRIPKDLLGKIARSAFVTSKSQNAEIVERLRASFDKVAGTLPFAIQEAIKDEVEARGGSEMEALARLVLLGQSKGGTVFQVTLKPGVTTGELRALMEESKQLVPPDADFILERE